MTRSTSIQRATATDLETILDLLQAQFAEHHIAQPLTTLEAAVRTVLASDRLGLFLAACRSTVGVIGLAYLCFNWTLEHGGHSAWLDELHKWRTPWKLAPSTA